uniref:Testis-expressed protein 43-like n=1 Tax=Ciona intestinalis TaxID=7719 RepID=H2XZ14_CIOIN|nr:testis-expressed protein 43-like isoform X1 [Ciona intestinalis]|eukprot:XP_002129969.1 testis-expressed protein 43-like isoform X1 [Ciona intestinalis]
MSKVERGAQTTIAQSKLLVQHVPNFSRLHPVIPKRYVPEWKTDMKNRNKLIQNAKLAEIYPGPHDESLFLEKRERLTLGEKRDFVESKTISADRKTLLSPPFPSHMSRYQSELMYRRNPWEE